MLLVCWPRLALTLTLLCFVSCGELQQPDLDAVVTLEILKKIADQKFIGQLVFSAVLSIRIGSLYFTCSFHTTNLLK